MVLEMRSALSTHLKLTELEKKALKYKSAAFWRAHQSFFALLTLSAKIPGVCANSVALIGIEDPGLGYVPSVLHWVGYISKHSVKWFCMHRDLCAFCHHHRSIDKQMCPAMVAMAKTALAEGHCIVIGIQTTGEARLKDHIEE